MTPALVSINSSALTSLILNRLITSCTFSMGASMTGQSGHSMSVGLARFIHSSVSRLIGYSGLRLRLRAVARVHCASTPRFMLSAVVMASPAMSLHSPSVLLLISSVVSGEGVISRTSPHDSLLGGAVLLCDSVVFWDVVASWRVLLRALVVLLAVFSASFACLRASCMFGWIV